MNARSFGFVLARGLAVFFLINCTQIVGSLIQYSVSRSGDLSMNSFIRYSQWIELVQAAFEFTLAGLLWARADRFGDYPGAEPDANQPFSPDTVWKLACAIMGLFYIVSSFATLSSAVLNEGMIQLMDDKKSGGFLWSRLIPALLHLLAGLFLLGYARGWSRFFRSRPLMDDTVDS